MNIYNKFERGSEWRKWDLHIHSDASDGKANCKEIIEEAKEKGISVIALTDHHTAKNIDTIKREAESSQISVISGIEFRTEYGSSSVHIIGLFPEKFKDTKLDSKALHELILSPLNLSETIIESKGKEENSTLSGDAAFKEGMFKVQVSFIKAADLIHKYGGLVVVHAGSKSNSIDEEMKHEGSAVKNVHSLYESLGVVKVELFEKGYIDICEIRKENDSEEFYLEKFNKPSIISSDAHKKEEIGSKFVWIKADPIFEGLKQIKYEPNRVKIQSNIPNDKPGYQVIDRIEIDNDTIYNKIIELNQDLNSIIGGKSTGKSILLGAIAKKLKTERSVRMSDIEYDKFIQCISDSLKVFWKDGIEDNNREIEYFQQGYMNEMATNENKLNNLIQDILKQKGKEPILNQHNKFNSENKKKISEMVSDFFQILKDIKEKKQKSREKGDLKGIEDEIVKLNEDIEKLNITSISENDKEEFEILKEKYFQSTQKKLSLNKDIYIIENLKSATLIKENISYELTSITDERKKTVDKIFIELKQEYTNNWKKRLQELILDIKNEIDTEENLTDKILKDPLYLKVYKAFEENDQLKEYVQKIQFQKDKLFEINAINVEIVELERQRDELKINIKSSHNFYFQKINELLPNLSDSKDGLEIKAKIKFNETLYREILNSSLNLQGYMNQEIADFKYKGQIVDFEIHLFNLFDKLISSSLTLKSGYSNYTLSNRILSECFYDLSYDIEFESDDFKKMSDGKKAFVVLKLLLDFSDKDCPIIIDQPEDDLDNRSIFIDLVQYLRKKKQLRQIILATHNPNIVVGADSELVICANQNGQKNINKDNKKFQYVSGSIENSFNKNIEILEVLESQGIREHVCEILEGGNIAFKLRENKYSID